MAKESGSYILSEEVLLTSYIAKPGSNEGVSINIRQLMQEIQIFESINNHVLTGYITLVDGAGVLDDLPLTGHEILSFKLHTPGFSPKDTRYPKGYDFTKNPMFIYKINNITKPTPGSKLYTLEFCSKEEIRNSQRKLSKAYHDRIDNSVRLILRTSLGSPKDFHFEKTKLKPKYVMPKMSPFNAIKFLAKESMSVTSNNAGFHFYETSTGFHFKSLSAMFHTGSGYKQPVMDYFDSPKTDSGKMYKSEDGSAGNLSKVIEFKILNRYDSLQNVREGVYASRMITYNAFNKTFHEQDFSYPHEYEKQRHMGQLKTGGESTNSGIMPIFNFEDGKMMSDFSEGKYMFMSSTQGLHDTQEMIPWYNRAVSAKGEESTAVNREVIDTVPIEDTLQRSIAQKHAFNTMVIKLLVPGNTAISAGEVINFSTLTNSGTDSKTQEEDPYLSGRYLVTEVRHLIQVKQHVTQLICAKDSVGKAYLASDKEVLNINEKGQSGTDFDEETIKVDEPEGFISSFFGLNSKNRRG
jgi:hypothetical protein